jgi:predicted RNA binding protein YcfA (HicA-like mRNA interferase family)
MPRSFDRELRQLLRDAGCAFVRARKGSHEVWESPITKRRFPVPTNIVSRHTANEVLKQAGCRSRSEPDSTLDGQSFNDYDE